MERNYWVVRQGKGGSSIQYAKENSVIGLGWSEYENNFEPLKNLDRKNFVAQVAPELEKVNPGNAPGNYATSARQLYNFVSIIQVGDAVVVPTREDGIFHFGIIQSDYYFTSTVSEEFPFRHRRNVQWIAEIPRDKFSQNFKNSSGSILSVFSLTPYAEEIESAIFGKDQVVGNSESQKEFGMEAHLEDFIVENWQKLSDFDNYEIYQEDGEVVGQQYITSIGRLDILARSKNGKEWLVIELKKGKSSDDVVGQTLRYIGWITENLAQEDEKVSGLIITGAEDERLKYALATLNHVDFMTYKVNFSLEKK